MRQKRRIKKLYQRERKAESLFTFAPPCSICVSAEFSDAQLGVAKAFLITIQRQSRQADELLLLCNGEKVRKLAEKASKKNPSIKFFLNREALLKAESETECKLIFRTSIPLPDHILFHLETSAIMHPDDNVFSSAITYLEKEYILKAYRTHILNNSSADTLEALDSVTFTPKTYDGSFTETANKNGKNAKICAGMVLFNPDVSHSVKNAESILPQVDRLFFVDNGSENIDEFAEHFTGNPKVTFIRNGENKGIAFALNCILNAAYENGYDWVLTLDQDTICDTNMIAVYKRFIHVPKLGIISPYIIHRGNKSLEQYKNEPIPEIEFIFDFDKCITSASLTNVKAAKEVGGFNDELFIDAVDFDLNQKLLMNDYFILKANDTYIIQEIGNRIPIYFYKKLYKITRMRRFNFVAYYSVHSDFRLYYIARNYKWFLRKYKVTSPTVNRWANFKDMLLRFMLYPKDRSRRKMFKIVRKGYRDSKKMTY